MAKQSNMFGQELAPKEETKYSSKIEAPIYEPKNLKPHVLELYDNTKTKRLAQEINNSTLEDDVKRFLLHAAQRHTVFNYERIADYYAHSSKEVQEMMERSALVIIDFDKAIQLGYIQLCDSIRNQYMEDYGE